MKKLTVSLACMLIVASAGSALAAMAPNTAALTGATAGGAVAVLAVELPKAR